MDPKLKALLKKPLADWDADDNKLYEQATKKKYTLKDLTKVAQEDWGKKEEQAFKNLTALNLPKNIVMLSKGESLVSLGSNAAPYCYTVQAGDTIKSISEKFNVSYGELTTSMMNKQGNTSLRADTEIIIPRYYLDLSKA